MAREIPFRLSAPISIFRKAGAAPDDPKSWRIGGVVSTEMPDREQEIVVQKGLDFTDFLRAGWFNDNHSKRTCDILGYPEHVTRYQKGAALPDGKKAPTACTWVEGYLIPKWNKAKEVWDLAQALQPTDRRLRFSVEGKVLHREGPDKKIVAKATVRNIAITNCFPGDVRVVGTGEAVTRRWYSGPMIEIELSTGQKLTGTPNHPVFTQRGWVALGDLDEVHDRVGCGLRNNLCLLPAIGEFSSAVSHDEENMPTPLQELFDLAGVDLLGVSRWVSAVREGQFHGDVLVDGYVDVVAINGFLKRRLDAAFFQKFGKSALPASDKQLQSFASTGSLRLDFQRVMRPTADGLCLDDPLHSLMLLQGGHSGGSAGLLLPLGSSDPISFGDQPNQSTGHSVTGCDVGRRLSPFIGFSNLVLKRGFDFSGHVFNLQTGHGWYEANGIVAHNCPINDDTRLEVLAKSLMAAEKGLTMGDAHPGQPDRDVTMTGEGAGQILARQDLEHDKQRSMKVLDYPATQPKKLSKPKKSKKARKSLNTAEAISWVKSRCPGVSEATAQRVVDLARLMSRQRPGRS